MSSKIFSGVIFGTTLFAALSAVSFSFKGDRVTFLFQTHYSGIISGLLLLAFLLLLFFHGALSAGQKVGLGVLFLFLPFTFWFSDGHISFLFQPAQAGIALGCLASALLLLITAWRAR